MFITRYDFAGDSTELLKAWDALVAQVGDDLIVHLAIATEDGLTCLDACPDRATFEQFRADHLPGLFTDNGLPVPTITPMGEGVRVVANHLTNA